MALVSSTLLTWYTQAGIAITMIGLLTFTKYAYFLKFLWAPLLDRYNLPLGRRRSWMLLMQLTLIISLWIMASLHPAEHGVLLAGISLLTALASATQDIAINAYQADCLTESERGLGAALYVGGYRAAMLVSGGVALIMAAKLGFAHTYRIMALLLLAGVACTLWIDEPANTVARAQKDTSVFQQTFLAPFIQLLQRDQAWRILCFVALYKISEAFTSTSGTGLVNTFLLRQLHFTLTEIGLVNKMFGFVAIMVGMFVGGTLLTKLALQRALLWFGVCQVVANASFILLVLLPKSILLLAIAVALENFAGGLVTAALLALIMSVCDKRYSATQFALLTALGTMGGTLIGPVTGYIVSDFGWLVFFILAVVLAMPPLLCIPNTARTL